MANFQLSKVCFEYIYPTNCIVEWRLIRSMPYTGSNGCFCVFYYVKNALHINLYDNSGNTFTTITPNIHYTDTRIKMAIQFSFLICSRHIFMYMSVNLVIISASKTLSLSSVWCHPTTWTNADSLAIGAHLLASEHLCDKRHRWTCKRRCCLQNCNCCSLTKMC